MWFNDFDKNGHTCHDCRHGSKDIGCKYCRDCMFDWAFNDCHYSNWESIEVISLMDKLKSLKNRLDGFIVLLANKYIKCK